MIILTRGEWRVGTLSYFLIFASSMCIFRESSVFFFNVALLCSFILSDVALYFEEAGLFSQQISILMHLCSFLFYCFCSLVLHQVKSAF